MQSTSSSRRFSDWPMPRVGAARQGWRLTSLAAVALLMVGPLGCDKIQSAPPKPYKVAIAVTSDPGEPLPAVDLMHNGKPIAKTGKSGRAKIKLSGAEGSTVLLHVNCPKGYQSPSKPLAITLRRMAQSSSIPEYTASCPPATRTIVVAVRADGGANLPVMYLGRQVATTDSAGAAHVLLKLPPSETFQLMLRTSGDNGNAALRPQDPIATFVVKQRNDIFSFYQKFQVKRYYHHYKPRGPRGPTPLTR